MNALRSARPRRLVLAVALSAAWPAAAAAQRAADLLPAGARVRLYFPGGAAPSKAEFVRASGDTLWVQYLGAADTATIARSTLRELRVYQGRGPRRVGRGMGRGLLAGAGVGAAVGLLTAGADPDGASFVGGPAGAMALMAGVGALPGAVIGGLASRRPEVWARVPLR